MVCTLLVLRKPNVAERSAIEKTIGVQIHSKPTIDSLDVPLFYQFLGIGQWEPNEDLSS